MSELLKLVKTAFRQVDFWGPQEWLLALIIVLSIGFACLRGWVPGRTFDRDPTRTYWTAVHFTRGNDRKQNSMIDLPTIHLPATVALAAIATLGYLLGLIRTRNRKADSNQSRNELRKATNAARELEKIAWSVRGNISRHHSRLGHFKKRIADLRKSAGSDKTLQALADEAEQILTPTLRLASQIASAYDRIREQTDQLTSLAGTRTDPLTGLANRHLVEETITSQFATMRRYQSGFSAALFDIDQFHRINDIDGGFHGDQILQQLARLLVEVGRETDVVARFGGQAFVIVMPQTDLEGASYFAERFRIAVENLHSVTISGGVTTALDGDDLGQMLARLEESLQVAKHKGGNRVFRHDGIEIESIIDEKAADLAVC